MKPKLSLALRWKRIRALVMDVDGVLTDGGMYYGPNGEEMKKFHTRDGMGIALLRKAGFHLGFITGEKTEIVSRRAEKLKVEDVYLGIEEKGKALEDFASKHSLKLEEIAYIGDDINDLPCLQRAGIAIAVADAVEAVQKVAHVITKRRGGEGAVREIADIVLRNRS